MALCGRRRNVQTVRSSRKGATGSKKNVLRLSHPTSGEKCEQMLLDQCLLLLIFFRAEPLCIAMWSVLSLLIKYCGSSFEARTVYVLNLVAEVSFFLIVPRTRPASEFHET